MAVRSDIRKRPPPQVALLVETSTTFGRNLLRGLSLYLRENGPWSVRLEQRSIRELTPPWLKKWRGDGVISRLAEREKPRLTPSPGALRLTAKAECC